MVVRKQQHFFAAVQQRAHKLAHIRRFCHARGLPRVLADGFLQHRPFLRRKLVVLFPAQHVAHHGRHQLGVYLVVPVQLLHQAALRRQLAQHLLLCPAEHQPLPPQVRAEQIGLQHKLIAVAAAPLARERLPVA